MRLSWRSASGRVVRITFENDRLEGDNVTRRACECCNRGAQGLGFARDKDSLVRAGTGEITF